MFIDKAILEDLGHNLAKERLRSGLTQAQLATEAGVSLPTIKRLEAGNSTQLTNLIRILRALNLLDNFANLVPDYSSTDLKDLVKIKELVLKLKIEIGSGEMKMGHNFAEINLWGTHIASVEWQPEKELAYFEYTQDFISSGIELSPLMMPLSSKIFLSCFS